MNEQYQQFLAFLQQQNGGQGFNIPINTLNNSQMQGYTQNAWNNQANTTPNFASMPVSTPDMQNPLSLGTYSAPVNNQSSGFRSVPTTFSPLQSPQQSQYQDPFSTQTYATQTAPTPADLSYNNNGFTYNPNAVDLNNAPSNSITINPTTDSQPISQNQYAFLNAFPIDSTENATFKLGQSLAFNSNNPYASDKAKGLNTVRGIAAGGKTLASLLRTGLSGAAYQSKQNDTVTDFYNRQNQQDFAPLYENGGQVSQVDYMNILKNKKILKYKLSDDGYYEVEYE